LSRKQQDLSGAINAAIDNLVERNTERESSERYRCTLSGKLFLEPKFIRKHIISKHEHLVERSKKEAISKFMFHLYMVDPKKRVSPRMLNAKDRQRQDRNGGRDRKRSRKDNSRGVPTGPPVPLLSTGPILRPNILSQAGGLNEGQAPGGFRAFAPAMAGGSNGRKQNNSRGNGGKGGKGGNSGLASYANVNAMDDDDVNYERR